MKFFLFNTTIMPNDGVFINEKISTEKAFAHFYKLADNGSGWLENYTSAIGHQGTADVFNQIFGLDGGEKVIVNRIAAQMETGDEALCLKVLGRLPEGQILTIEELQNIGFEFYRVKMIAKDHNELESDARYCGAAPVTGSIWNF